MTLACHVCTSASTVRSASCSCTLTRPSAGSQRSLRMPLTRSKRCSYARCCAAMGAGTRNVSSRSGGQKKDERICALSTRSVAGLARGVEGGLRVGGAGAGRRAWGVRGKLGLLSVVCGLGRMGVLRTSSWSSRIEALMRLESSTSRSMTSHAWSLSSPRRSLMSSSSRISFSYSGSWLLSRWSPKIFFNSLMKSSRS